MCAMYATARKVSKYETTVVYLQNCKLKLRCFYLNRGKEILVRWGYMRWMAGGLDDTA